jgi:hypothetical protein
MIGIGVMDYRVLLSSPDVDARDGTNGHRTNGHEALVVAA